MAGLTLNADGSYSFDPTNPAYNGLAAGETQDVVATYTVSDGNGGTATSTLTITVTGTNDAPVAVADLAAATEDGPVVTGSVAANDTDPDGDDLSYSLDAPVAGLTLNADGSYSFDPTNPAYNGLAAGETQDVVATYTVSDGNGGTATSTLTITVTGTNDAPVINSGMMAEIDENQPAGTVVYQAAATDPDGDVLVYSLAGVDAADFTIDPQTGTVTQNQPLDFEDQATYNFTVIATDPAGLTDSVDVVLTVNNQLDVLSLDVDDDGDINIPRIFDASEANFLFTDQSGVESNAEIINFDGDDIIQVDAPTASYSFSTVNDGSNAAFDDLIITLNNAGVVSQIVIQDAIAAGTFVNSEATAEAAIGYDFFTSTAPPLPEATVSLDIDSDSNLNSVEIFDAGGTQTTFTDDAGTNSNAQIIGFGPDDVIQGSGDAADYSFSTQNDGSSQLDDILISINNAGVISQIVIQDVANPGTFVFDEATAEQAAGFDFFQADAGVTPPPPPPPPAAQTVSADVDDDGNITTLAQFDAGGAAVTFLDDGQVASRVTLSNVGLDDVYELIGFDPSEVSFSTVDDDLIVTFNGPNGVNEIVVEDVVDPSTFVFDEASAEAAMGDVLNNGVPFDFFQAG